MWATAKAAYTRDQDLLGEDPENDLTDIGPHLAKFLKYLKQRKAGETNSTKAHGILWEQKRRLVHEDLRHLKLCTDGEFHVLLPTENDIALEAFRYVRNGQ